MAERAKVVAERTKSGMTEVARTEERLALAMLIPSFLVILLVAIYPLFTVFRDSVTDRVFASSQPVKYVGLGNFVRLLSVTIVELPPVIDAATGKQAVDKDTGAPVYVRPIQVLPREPSRFREVTQFSLSGKRYVIGASELDFVKAVGDTMLFSVISVVLETLLGLVIALVVNGNFRGRGFMRAAMLVPWAIITVVSARMWQWMFEPTRAGLFNVILQALGLGDGQIAFLRTDSLQLPSLIAVDVWKTTPFMALLILAGLQLIPQDLYKAADVDGAGKVKQFFAITLPLLRPAIAVALIFRTLDALRVFDVFEVLLSRTRYSMASYAQSQLIEYQNAGMSAAASVIIFVLIFVFAILYIRLLWGEAE
jgi:trehalose/maltose transport system permease protein